MTAIAAKATFSYRTSATIKSILGYGVHIGRNLNGFLSTNSRSVTEKTEKELNKLLRGYPRNHNYRICKKKLFPSFRLYERLRLVTQLYPEKLKSFLDVGCCRGFYVLEAAKRTHCQIALGIDVHEPFISIGEKLKQYLDMKNVNFQLARLDEVAKEPEAYGGPFQTVLLIGTYHYLFWGSFLCPTAYYSHREILARLFNICSDRLIFSARLEVDRLPEGTREKAKQFSSEIAYSTADFLENAEEFFHVNQAGYLGTYPLFLMLKKEHQKP